MREHRHCSRTGRPIRTSSAVVYFVLPQRRPHTRRHIEAAWASHAASGRQRISLSGQFTATTLPNDRVLITASAVYGPVAGNAPSDYRRKAEDVGALLHGVGGLIDKTFDARVVEVQQ